MLRYGWGLNSRLCTNYKNTRGNRMTQEITSTESTIEQEIQDKGLNAPRLTPELINSVLAKPQYHVFGNSCLTVCCLTLVNGFTVTGESACASPENFDAEIGKKIAFEQARNKVWMLEGYLLKQRLFEGSSL
jgi:hypothetical protein